MEIYDLKTKMIDGTLNNGYVDGVDEWRND